MTSTTFKINEYIGQTTRTSRPVAEDARIYRDPADLAAHQARWDAAETQRLDNERLRDARIAKVDADRQAEADRRRTKARSDLEGAVKAQFMARGDVSEADWQRLKQGLIDAELAKDPQDQRVAEMRRQYAGIF